MAVKFICPRCGRTKTTKERQVMADPPTCDYCKDEYMGRKVPVYMRPTEQQNK